jgi:hypothetical protein
VKRLRARILDVAKQDQHGVELLLVGVGESAGGIF